MAPRKLHCPHGLVCCSAYMTDTLADLELLMKSRQGLIVLDTIEEERVLTLLRLLADRMTLPLFQWSRTRGLRRDGNDNAVYGTTDPVQALAHIGSSTVHGLYYLAGVEPLLQDSGYAERLREVATQLSQQPGAIVLSGVALELPEALRRLSATVELPAPDTAEFRRLMQRILRDVNHGQSGVQLTTEEENRLLEGLRGLTLLEAEKVLTRAIVEDGRLTADDIAHVIRAKKEIVEREGVLEYYPAEEALGAVAGLEGLKDWLSKRAHIIRSPKKAAEFGLSFPKGLLLIGVPGCGKSLSARAVAHEWGLPLLRLDPGALYNKYIGETEKNFRRACDVAEKVAPCVLFIDEIEKAFAGNGSGEDGGVSQRVFGSFLSWLQDRKAPVFTVATANDVQRLPPELLRKGRFDEVFFVDLPDTATRRQIVQLHLQRRNQDPAQFDLDAIADATEEFSGAELEQVIVAALYSVFAAQQPLSTAALLTEARSTRPLARVMSEKVAALRAWARDRTVPAN